MTQLFDDVDPWWSKKRWWAVGLVLAWIAYLSVPYSLHGPAMSCWTALNERANDRAAEAYAKKTEYLLSEFDKYMKNSGFYIVNIIENRGEHIGAYFLSRDILTCFPLGFIAIDGSVVRFSLYNRNGVNVVEKIGK